MQFSAENFLSGRALPFHFLVKIHPGFWYSSDLLSSVYAESWFPNHAISFRIIPDYPIAAIEQQWRIGFGADAEGVKNAKILGIFMPYENVDIVQLKENRLERIPELSAADLTGLAKWIGSATAL